MHADIDLGTLRLCVNSDDLALTVDNSAVFSCRDPESLAIDNLQTADQLLSSKYWVTQGASLQFVIDIRWDDNVQFDATRETLQHRITTALHEAEMWKQLRFEPSVTVQPSQGFNTLGQTTIHLVRAEDSRCQTSDTFKKVPHRLETDVPFVHIKPPPGTASLCLEQVHMSISLHRKAVSGNDYDHLCQVGEENVDARSALPRAAKSRAVSLIHNVALFGSVAPPTNDEYDFASSSNSTPSDGSDDPMLLDSMLIADALEFPYEPEVYALDTPQIDSSVLVNALDAAVRQSFAACAKMIPGTFVTDAVSFTRLADIAPGLWSPNFLPAVASRAMFMPTISHALVMSAIALPQASLFKSKILEIARQEDGSQYLEDRVLEQVVCDETTAQTVQDTVSTRLWWLMRNGLYDPNATKHLSALECGNRRPRTLDTADDELLLEPCNDDWLDVAENGEVRC